METLALIAIVDDDDAVRRALRRLLRSLSYEPIDFPSGETFLASLEDARPDCVLMDQHMPMLNGLDVLGRMRTSGMEVPVIIITGFDQPGLRRKCMDAGAAAYLVKPLDTAVISTEIQRAID